MNYPILAALDSVDNIWNDRIFTMKTQSLMSKSNVGVTDFPVGSMRKGQ